MRIPLSSLQAFVHDAEAKRGSESAASLPINRWLAIAQAAERLSLLPAVERKPYLNALAVAVLPDRVGRPTLIEGDGRLPADELTLISERIRLEVEDMERGGCYELALCTISAVCRMLANAPIAGRLLATAHMGRVMRQLGDLDAATDCYRSVAEDGLSAREPGIAAYGFNGLGIVATFRGNRPAQREHFSAALTYAPRGSPAEVGAHQGLLLVSVAQLHLADALLHGWRAHDLAPPESETQLEIVNNMAHVALQSGFPQAARAGFEHTIGRTNLARLRMPAISGAVRASAALREPHEVHRFEALGIAEISNGALPFETAQYFQRCAESWHELSDMEQRDTYVGRAQEIADRFGFHEIRIKLDGLRSRLPSIANDHKPDVPFTVDEADPIVRRGIERLETLGV